MVSSTLVLALMLAPKPAEGADYFWRGSGGTGGSGDWDTTSLFWFDTTTKAWANSNNAVFGSASDTDAGLGGTVTLKTAVTVSALRFLSKSNGYFLQGDSTLRILTANGNLIIDPAATVTFGQNLTVQRGTQFHIEGGGKVIVDSGATVQTTSGILNINGGATVEVKTGGILSSADTLVVGNVAATNATNGVGTLLVTGGVVNAGGGGGSRNFILGDRGLSPGDVTVTLSAGEINVSPAASNGLAFENSGASSAYFNLDGGTLSVRRVVRNTSGGSPNADEESFFNFNGGLFRVNAIPNSGSDQLLGAGITYRVKGGGARIDTNGFNVTINQALQSAASTDGGLTKLGEGVLTLANTAASNNYNGGTRIEAGTLSIGADSNLGAAPSTAIAGNLVINDGATLRTNSAGTLTLNVNRGIALGALTGAGAGTIEVQTGTMAFGGVISNRGSEAGGLIKTGTGLLSLTGSTTNTFSGPITIKAGTLRAASVARLGTSNSIVLDGGAFEFTGGGLVEAAINVTSNGGTLMGNAWRQNGNITGGGTLTIATAAASYISTSGDNSTFTGAIIVSTGEFQLRKAAGMGTTAGNATVRSGAALALDQNGTGGAGNVHADNNYKDALVLEDNATLRNKGGSGGGATDSIYSGAITVQSGVAIMDVVSKVLTIQSVISGSGGINKTGTGELVLESASSYTGKTTVSAGRLSLGTNQTLGDAGSIANSAWIQVNNGAIFAAHSDGFNAIAQVLSGTGTFAGDFTLGGTAAIRPGDSTNQALSALASAGDLTGTLTFTGNLTFSGNASATTRAVFGLGGNGTGQFDRIVTTGSLTVGDNTRLEVVWAGSYQGGWGDAFDLMDWATGFVSWGSFDASSESFLELPDFAPGSGLVWDTSTFKVDGIIRVAPEPSRALMILAGLSTLAYRRRRHGAVTF